MHVFFYLRLRRCVVNMRIPVNFSGQVSSYARVNTIHYEAVNDQPAVETTIRLRRLCTNFSNRTFTRARTRQKIQLFVKKT